MSCGNRFQCALNKSSRFQFQSDKPSNPELYNENQKRLNELLKARDEIDKQFLNKDINNTKETTQITNIEYKVSEPTFSNNLLNSTNFTPWVTPSTQEYISNPK
jgi:hypothetical protein